VYCVADHLHKISSKVISAPASYYCSCCRKKRSLQIMCNKNNKKAT